MDHMYYYLLPMNFDVLPFFYLKIIDVLKFQSLINVFFSFKYILMSYLSAASGLAIKHQVLNKDILVQI